MSSDLFGCLEIGTVQRLPLEALYLGFDGLKDSFTLLNTPLLDSPHFKLMECLRNGGDAAQSEYALRAGHGTLDFRPSIKVVHSYIVGLEARYAQSAKTVRTADLRPVQVAKLAEKYYIANGKHRAAVCALEGIAPRCVDVSPVLCDSFFWWVYRKMLKRPRDYQVHIRFFESIRSELPRHGIH